MEDNNQLNVRERRKRIVELVNRTGYYRSSDLTKEFEVSTMTVRRDIKWLANSGLVQSIHGGAQSLDPGNTNYSYDIRLKEHQLAKQAVAQIACNYLKPNTIIALDGGTTAFEFARVLPPDMDLTVVTYSLPVMSVLSKRKDIELISLGGVLLKQTQSFVGQLTNLTLNELRISTLFLGARTVHNGYIYSGFSQIIDVKRALINASEKVILLVDSSKFLESVGFRMASLNDIDLVIVDDSKDIKEYICGLEDVEIIQVPIKSNTERQSE